MKKITIDLTRTYFHEEKCQPLQFTREDEVSQGNLCSIEAHFPSSLLPSSPRPVVSGGLEMEQGTQRAENVPHSLERVAWLLGGFSGGFCVQMMRLGGLSRPLAKRKCFFCVRVLFLGIDIARKGLGNSWRLCRNLCWVYSVIPPK